MPVTAISDFVSGGRESPTQSTRRTLPKATSKQMQQTNAPTQQICTFIDFVSLERSENDQYIRIKSLHLQGLI